MRNGRFGQRAKRGVRRGRGGGLGKCRIPRHAIKFMYNNQLAFFVNHILTI